MSANATLTAAGLVRMSGYFTHANYPDSKIVIVGVVWNRQNNRWESDTAGTIRVVDYADRTGKVIVLGKSVGR